MEAEGHGKSVPASDMVSEHPGSHLGASATGHGFLAAKEKLEVEEMKELLVAAISHEKIEWCVVYFYNRFFRKSARIDFKTVELENL